jgi:hypothetical protein
MRLGRVDFGGRHGCVAVWLAVLLLPAGGRAEERFLIDPAPVLSPAARGATEAYRLRHYVGVEIRIPDGYVDGGRGMVMHGDGRVTSSREIIVVDRARDARLREWLAFARSEPVQALAPRERAERLADFVIRLDGTPADGEALVDDDRELARRFASRGLLIGDVPLIASGSVCRHRALIFKLLGDEAGLPTALVRGRYRHSDGRLGAHAWNELHLDDGRLVVDLMASSSRRRYIAAGSDRAEEKYLDLDGRTLYRAVSP